MAYNLNTLQQQLQDLSAQYQALLSNQRTINTPQAIVQQPSQVPIPVAPRQVQYVEGLNGAKIYQDNMQVNSSEVIMDKEDNIFYYVSKDANGTPSKRIMIGRFTLEESQEQEPMFLTRKDFDDFKDEIRQMLIENTQPKQVVLNSQKKQNVMQGDK